MDIKSRLNTVIEKDKKNNPQYISNVLRSDFYYLINNYFEVDFDDIKINIDLEKDKYHISLDCQAERIKFIRSLPWNMHHK